MSDDICGYEDTHSGEPCQRQAGWGRDEDTGLCKGHHPDYESDCNRPSKISYERQETIATAIEKGRSMKSAARMANIEPKTLFNWMDRGRAEKEAGKENAYTDFVERITRAKGHGEEYYFKTIVEMAKENEDHRFLASLMKQRYPESWAQKDDAPGVDTDSGITINVDGDTLKQF